MFAQPGCQQDAGHVAYYPRVYTIQTKVKSSEIERKTFSKSVGGRGKDAPARKGANNDHQRIPMISTGI